MKTKPKNHIAIVLDRSGSMQTIANETVREFNDRVKTIQEQSVAHSQDTAVTYITFSNFARTEFFNSDARTLKALDRYSYSPSGQTALFDGVGLAIEELSRSPDASSENTSFLVMVLTDGDENNSGRYSTTGGGYGKRNLLELLKEKQNTDRWSFAFQLPPGAKAEFCRRFGVLTDNVFEWAATKKGVEQASQANTEGLKSYFIARSQGKKKVDSFYVTTDLSQVAVKEVHAKLDDISDKFKAYEVPSEQPIKEFVESKTGKPYVIGSAYYLLMKAEKVQPTKAILLMEKGKKAIWGGPEARALIGLPTTGTVKVVPGNHSGYDVFCNSTSVNRRLVRGTKLLVDITKSKDDAPTWDHVAAEAAAQAKLAAQACQHCAK